jgi:hypothetical protein
MTLSRAGIGAAIVLVALGSLRGDPAETPTIDPAEYLSLIENMLMFYDEVRDRLQSLTGALIEDQQRLLRESGSSRQFGRPFGWRVRPSADGGSVW